MPVARHPVVLAIGGSDPSGGAGIQGDLKTLHQHGAYGAAAITLLTVQSTRGVSRVDVLDASLVAAQVDAVRADLPVAALKTGALGSAAIVRAMAARVGGIPLVCDPVLLATHGGALTTEEARAAILEALVPRAALVTPNALEAAALTGIEVVDAASAVRAGEALLTRGARAVLVKGGHVAGASAIDVLVMPGEVLELAAPRLTTEAGHGTGCALASSIAARLAHGNTLVDAVRGAKAWVHAALAGAPGLGSGRGPLDLFAATDPA